ncbi:hypothetical protein [Psychrobium sp. 1_MG-2023]|uniref:hypothetical protein n=1 Tax=Psychrobium sp. 1_MG-2023 TaxID=3062624 RepID=UPI000C3454F0|nr:hypothetical protein [Psychrobium sp. 1_MG-2023]MDP2562767.1 hypothetical protein [Psychrobium sp. 1_MG-2023]PKF57692.1 hypothetical protein CW748_05725 [Alteromonadales bacterium alter-6D02]
MKYLILLSSLFLTACSSTPSSFNITETMNIIALAEEHAPQGIKGVFKFKIKASGVVRGKVYLNTELDYRDRRSISVSIAPQLVPEFVQQYGEAPDSFFINKKIEVTGQAKRIKILFISNGRATEKYYYQTHVEINALEQIKLIG